MMKNPLKYFFITLLVWAVSVTLFLCLISYVMIQDRHKNLDMWEKQMKLNDSIVDIIKK